MCARHPATKRFNSLVRSRQRVEEDGAEADLVWVNSDPDPSLASPDLTTDPDQVETSRPWTVTITPPMSGELTYRIVSRRRNKYRVNSSNQVSDGKDQSSYQLTIDSAGNEIVQAPSDPINLTATAIAGGVVRVTAEYRYPVDADNIQADTFAIWITTSGTDPDPDVDAVTATESMVKVDGVAYLVYDTGAQANGTVVKAAVAARRSSDGVDSAAEGVVSATADTSTPSAPDVGLYFGDSGEAEQ